MRQPIYHRNRVILRAATQALTATPTANSRNTIYIPESGRYLIGYSYCVDVYDVNSTAAIATVRGLITNGLGSFYDNELSSTVSIADAANNQYHQLMLRGEKEYDMLKGWNVQFMAYEQSGDDCGINGVGTTTASYSYYQKLNW